MRTIPRLSLLSVCIAAAAAHPATAQTGPATLPPEASVGGLYVTSQSPDPWVFCRGPDAIAPFAPVRPGAGSPETSETIIDFDNLQADEESGHSIFEGDVQLERGTQWLGTDRLVYVHEEEDYLAEGNVRYQDASLRMLATRAEGNTGLEVHHLDQVRYQLLSQRGNGGADTVDVRGVLSTLHGASFSTCDPVDRKWELRARRLDLDQDEGEGVARGVTVRVGNVPVLYTPWLSFPLDDRRKTGFLYPTVGYDNELGLDLFLPYYLNLAPNYDLTLTPRIMSRRGVMLGSEFRYLFGPHSGTVEAWYLPSDDKARDPALRGSDRYEYRIGHRTVFNQQWYGLANVHRVSDPRYFEDFSVTTADRERAFLESNVGLYGRGRYWTTSIEARDWQITDALIADSAEPFMELPRLRFNYDRPLGDYLTVGLRSEAVGFRHDIRSEGSRLDLKPYLRADFAGSWWFLAPQVAYRHTQYELDAPVRPGGDTSPSRSVPIYSVDGGLFFDRDVEWFGRSLINTLEPRLFYLRVPYRDHSDIPIFDTRDLLFSFPQLFRDNRFSGADRQADANQLAAAVTTRLFEPGSGRELGSLAVGRINYFDPPRIPPTSPATVLNDSGSFYVVDANVAVSDRWSFGSSYQWDPASERTQLNTYRIRYDFENGGLVNAAYRYRRDLLEQTDISAVYPLSPSWRLVGRWAYSLPDQSTLDATAGVEWQSCCMAVRVLGRHYLRGRYTGNLDNAEKGNAIYFELELKGLGSFGRKTDDLLTRSILGYTR
ncbi:LPS assembly protein LptD [Coralloluteibacterium thermophilus]|uniref:LPS-assembly protein LptD n=1 Tax=Coralloluteibacterium thermophilum TaxID=2707049 RepID=A0ABV9NMX5_9GAMM